MGNFQKFIDMMLGCSNPEQSNSFLSPLPGTGSSDTFEYVHQRQRRDNSSKNMDFAALQIFSEIGLSIKSQECWWVKYPQRALHEIQSMMRNTNSTLDYSGRKLIWEEVIRNNFNTWFHITIETEGYPYKIPKVFIKNSEIKFKKGKHMNSDESLCLMDSSDFNSKKSVLQIRNQACAWCWAVEVYTHTGEWPAAEH
jgi:hypothetical protein